MKKSKKDLMAPRQPQPSRQPSALSRTESIKLTYQAPLPPAGMVEHYERIMPGAADRLFRMAESQQDHREGLENRRMDSDITNEKRGQIFAFIIALVAVFGSFGLIWYGISTIGVTLFITTFAGLVSLFVFGRLHQAHERSQKREDMAKIMRRDDEQQ